MLQSQCASFFLSFCVGKRKHELKGLDDRGKCAAKYIWMSFLTHSIVMKTLSDELQKEDQEMKGKKHQYRADT